MSTSVYRFSPAGGVPTVRRAGDGTNEMRVSTYKPRHARPDDEPSRMVSPAELADLIGAHYPTARPFGETTARIGR